MYLTISLLIKTSPSQQTVAMQQPIIKIGLLPYLFAACRPTIQNKTPKKKIEPYMLIKKDGVQ